MSSLREQLAKMNAESPPAARCVETEFQPAAMVTFCPLQAKEWTVPWARLDAVSFSNEGESERVELFFPHHHVIAVGEHLRDIMDDIRHFKVRCLRDLPASHRASLKSDGVFISQLEVRSLADPSKHP